MNIAVHKHFLLQKELGLIPRLGFSREMAGERHVIHFDAGHHLVIILYDFIMRFDSLREITGSMSFEDRKQTYLGISLPNRTKVFYY